MTKIVYNTCFGGFRLSEAAVVRYAELKGLLLRIDRSGEYGAMFPNFWICTPEEQASLTEAMRDWANLTDEARRELSARVAVSKISPRDIPRDDPALAQVVEELGPLANGLVADLAIRELPPGTKYIIEEYDGNESVTTLDEFDWKEA